MMITTEQARCAAVFMQTSARECDALFPCDLPEGLVCRVRDLLEALPEYREDRVFSARERFASHPPESAEIAEKMLGRIVSDAIR